MHGQSAGPAALSRAGVDPLCATGSFGTVRTAFDRHNGRTLAAKILCKTKEGIDPERIAHRIKEEV